MGMFDEVRCHYPLPVAGANALEYQTKFSDFPNLDQYEIREDGTLWVEEYDIEDRSDPNADGLMRIVGCATRVNKRSVPFDHTGQMEFGTGMRGEWLEFCALFDAGVLKALVVVTQQPSVTP